MPALNKIKVKYRNNLSSNNQSIIFKLVLKFFTGTSSRLKYERFILECVL